MIFVGDIYDILWIQCLLYGSKLVTRKIGAWPHADSPVETAGFRGSSQWPPKEGTREQLNETWLERKCRGQSPWPLLVWSFWTWGELMEHVWQTLVSSGSQSFERWRGLNPHPNPHFLLDCESCQPSKSKRVNWAWGRVVSGRYPQRKPHMGQRWFRRRPTHRFIRCLDLMTQQGQPTKSTKSLRTVGIVCKLESLYNHISSFGFWDGARCKHVEVSTTQRRTFDLSLYAWGIPVAPKKAYFKPYFFHSKLWPYLSWLRKVNGTRPIFLQALCRYWLRRS